MYEQAPGAAGSYPAIGSEPEQVTEPGFAGSPGSNDSEVGRAVTVAQIGPTDAVTDTGRQESPPARKSSGVCTYAHPNSGSSISKTGTGFGSVRIQAGGMRGRGDDNTGRHRGHR